MFFYLSKALFFLIKPINWVAFLLLFAVFTKREKRRKRSLITATILCLFFSCHFIFNLVIRLHEPEPVLVDTILEPYDIGIVLGGYTSLNRIAKDDRHYFNARGNRFFQAFELYKTGKIKKMLLTGGNGSVLQDLPSEALEMERYLLKMGVPRADIIIEPNSRTTYENAIFTKEMIANDYPNAKCLLITSAWHMPRSRGVFQKAGMHFDEFPTDYLSEEIKFTPDDFLPSKMGFYYWELLIKEWVGYLGYWAKGYI